MYTAYAKFSKPKGQDHRFSVVKQAAEVVKIAPEYTKKRHFEFQCPKILRGGLPRWGEGHPLPTPHSLGAFGASILAPSALDHPQTLRRLVR